MLNTTVLFFNISSEFVQPFCLTCQQASECKMQRTMLAAIQAKTNDWLQLSVWCKFLPT